VPAAKENSSNAQILRALTPYPISRSTDAAINVHNDILPANLHDQMPAQFLYEPADCHIFYQPKMISDVAAMWHQAVNVAWGNASCVQGQLDLPKRRPQV
jgi:ABC-type thiamine transport system substrate-binding protein